MLLRLMIIEQTSHWLTSSASRFVSLFSLLGRHSFTQPVVQSHGLLHPFFLILHIQRNAKEQDHCRQNRIAARGHAWLSITSEAGGLPVCTIKSCPSSFADIILPDKELPIIVSSSRFPFLRRIKIDTVRS